MSDINNTGERILLEKETPLMIARHLSAYHFASAYAKGKSVLEIGSGEGYGSYLLSGVCNKITAIDYNKEAISYAKAKYERSNLHYTCLDIKELCELCDTYDLICCFQVIEHISQVDEFLKRTKSLLNKGGIFICSTPNKLDMSKGSHVPINKFHVREYLFLEFKDLLSIHFSKVDIIGLKRSPLFNFYRRLKKIGFSRILPHNMDPIRRFYSQGSSNSYFFDTRTIGKALDFIAICKE
ncbi:MAG: class I SAM-dependent methyltransferase [Candidatus Omnitrophota bacterium]